MRDLETAAAPRARWMEELGALFALNLLAGWILMGAFWNTSALHHDNLNNFSFFHDQWQSLNRFGEVAWWFPQNQFGWPAYFYSILGDVSAITPAFALIGFGCWLLGRAGVMIQSYHHIYVFYFAFLVPFLASLATWSFARQLTRSRLIRGLVMILTAFSPGVISNMSDIGFLEPAAYGVFFAAAYVNFLRRPARPAFWLLALTSMLLGLELNFTFMMWNVAFIPFLVFLAPIPFGGWPAAKKALGAVPPAYWAGLAGAVALCTLPNFLTLSQGKDLVQVFLADKSYQLFDLLPGNPLQLLSMSLRGFGFQWDLQSPSQAVTWALIPARTGATSYGSFYLGVLILPLVLLALLHGRRPLRTVLFGALTLMAGILCLSSYSPFLAPLLAVSSQLRANKHFNDLLFNAGGYLIVTLAAAFGLQTLLNGGAAMARRAAVLLVSCLAAYLVVYATHFGGELFGQPSFWLTLGLTALYGLTLRRLTQPGDRRPAKAALLALCLIDIASNTASYVGATFVGTPVEPAQTFDLRLQGYGNQWADSFMMYRPLFEMQKLQVNANVFAMAKLFSSAHPGAEMKDELHLLEKPEFGDYESLALSEEAFRIPEFSRFRSATPPGQAPKANGQVLNASWYTYNRSAIEVEAREPALLFVRDAYSPYWNATVNGRPAPVTRALYNFRAVAVPAGRSRVEFAFSPPGVGVSITLAYALLGLSALLYFRARRRNREPA